MKTNHFLLACAIIITLIVLPGCKKVQDVIGNHRLCKIKTLKILDPDNNRISLHITYNKYGNPVSVLGGPQMAIQFRYDKQNRLADCIYYAEWSGYVIEWNTYTYKPDNKTIIDTVYGYTSSYVTDSIHPNTASVVSETIYNLDNAGRITGFSGSTNFVYDKRGNLVRLQYGNYTREIKYDDKINLWQTDKVLQFIHNDYSVNNSLKSATFNQFGLPVIAVDSSTEDGPNHPVIFQMHSWKELEVEYDCAAKESYK